MQSRINNLWCRRGSSEPPISFKPRALSSLVDSLPISQISRKSIRNFLSYAVHEEPITVKILPLPTCGGDNKWNYTCTQVSKLLLKCHWICVRFVQTGSCFRGECFISARQRQAMPKTGLTSSAGKLQVTHSVLLRNLLTIWKFKTITDVVRTNSLDYCAVGRGVKYCDQQVFIHISPNFLYMLPVSVARSSSDGILMLRTSGFVDDVVFPYNGGIGANQKTTRIFRPVCRMAAPGMKYAVSDCMLFHHEIKCRVCLQRTSWPLELAGQSNVVGGKRRDCRGHIVDRCCIPCLLYIMGSSPFPYPVHDVPMTRTPSPVTTILQCSGVNNTGDSL